MQNLFKNIRFYVLVGSILLSAVILLWAKIIFVGNELQIIRLEQIYAFASIIFLYVTLLAGPFCYTFRRFPFREAYLKARRALGVSAFYFALLHTGFTFFGQLGGFKGIGFLGNSFLIAVLFGVAALIILFILTMTSFDFAVEKLTFPKWKLLHRFTYLTGILILIHTVLLGTHYSDITGPISQISFVLLAFLLLLESPRIDKAVRNVFPTLQFGLSFVLTAVVLSAIYCTFISPFGLKQNNPVSFDIHSTHRQLAQQALQEETQQTIGKIDISKLPGLNGDRNKRYTVSMSTDPAHPQPNQDTTIHFKAYDANSGNPVSFFRIVYAWPMHLMITDSTLTYFDHTHPLQQGSEFVHTTQFPTAGFYHLYIQFQPFGGIEQQMAFTLPVGIGDNETAPLATQPADTNLTKIFGDYEVTLDTHGALTAQDMSLGNDRLSFTVKDAKTKHPITTLKPFMAAFGHLTMISEQNYDFIHVHPYSVTVPPANANGGPTVDFLPIGIYGPFKSGTYRAFGEFSAKQDTDFDADFTVKVE